MRGSSVRNATMMNDYECFVNLTEFFTNLLKRYLGTSS